MTHPRDLAELSALLIQRGVVSPDAMPPARREHERPWFIGLITGAAGWLAGVFGLMFVGLLFKPETTTGYAVAGLVMLAAAFGLYASDREGAFFEQLALALSIAGQLALTWAVVEATGSAAAAAALVAVMQCVIVAVMPNRFAKLIAACFACIAWALSIRFAWWGEPSFSIKQGEPAVFGRALAGWCVIWIPVMALTSALIRSESRWMSKGLQRMARPALSGLILGLAVGTLVSEPLAGAELRTVQKDDFNWLALWPLLSAAAAIFAALCAFRIRNHALLGVCAAAALLHVIHFYYLLGVTLLLKSSIMLAFGVVLLAIAEFLHRRSITSNVRQS